MPNHNYIHHQHDISTTHYDISTHDQYPRHHHEWIGNNHFNTVNDDHGCADDHELVTGDDFDHPGFDVYFS